VQQRTSVSALAPFPPTDHFFPLVFFSGSLTERLAPFCFIVGVRRPSEDGGYEVRQSDGIALTFSHLSSSRRSLDGLFLIPALMLTVFPYENGSSPFFDP